VASGRRRARARSEAMSPPDPDPRTSCADPIISARGSEASSGDGKKRKGRGDLALPSRPLPWPCGAHARTIRIGAPDPVPDPTRPCPVLPRPGRTSASLLRCCSCFCGQAALDAWRRRLRALGSATTVPCLRGRVQGRVKFRAADEASSATQRCFSLPSLPSTKEDRSTFCAAAGRDGSDGAGNEPAREDGANCGARPRHSGRGASERSDETRPRRQDGRSRVVAGGGRRVTVMIMHDGGRRCGRFVCRTLHSLSGES
jgi:hypothetical protein